MRGKFWKAMPYAMTGALVGLTACGSSSGSASSAVYSGGNAANCLAMNDAASQSPAPGEPAALASSLGSARISHIPHVVSSFADQGQLDGAQALPITISLKLNNQAELEGKIAGMYRPGSPTYHQFMSPQEFRSRYAPTQEQIAAVKSYLSSHGIQATSVDPNGYFIHARASAQSVSDAFQTDLHRYRDSKGAQYFAPASEPVLPSDLGVQAVHGLQNVTRWHSYAVRRAGSAAGSHAIAAAAPDANGSGPSGGYSPQDIRAAYQIPTNQNGAGQTLAVMELDGYNSSDIQAYEQQFGLPNVPLQNVLLDGATGSAGGGIAEVTLDIELMTAIAPGASKILVYEGANSSQGILDLYSRIASDNTAREISTSWGSAEGSNTSAFAQSENTIFEQMAAQGQSIFSAAGDNGANDNGSSLSVDDPSGQPYVTGVGGTTLNTGSGGAYASESTWNSGGSGGGGGISSVWPQPSYQSGISSGQNLASSSMRNVPDVSLEADPATGYAVYISGSWTVYGGTSAAAPLWAAFTALVNQQRAASGLGPLGFANPSLYAIGRSANYGQDFHDISDGSTNGHYPAVSGYDAATGWGTILGSGLLRDLAADPKTSGC